MGGIPRRFDTLQPSMGAGKGRHDRGRAETPGGEEEEKERKKGRERQGSAEQPGERGEREERQGIKQ